MKREFKKQIIDLLNEHRIMTIATNRPDGWPQATVVGYCNDGMVIYCMISRDSQKFANIMRDPRIALLFLIPGVGETLRVNGRASISIDPELMQSFAVNGKLPRCVLIVHIESIYFHCSKAVVRSKLWDEATKIDRNSLPSTGTIVAELSQGRLGGEAYDRAAPERIKAQLY